MFSDLELNTRGQSLSNTIDVWCLSSTPSPVEKTKQKKKSSKKSRASRTIFSNIAYKTLTVVTMKMKQALWAKKNNK